MVLVDTSAWLFALGRKVAIPEVKQKVDGLLGENRLAVTPVVGLELLGGTRSRAEFVRLRSRLEALPQLPVGDREWQRAAEIAFDLGRQGKAIPYTDILIAATALVSGATLLHADRHFDVIAETTGLAVESLVSLIQELT